jgi:hypothetical protein
MPPWGGFITMKTFLRNLIWSTTLINFVLLILSATGVFVFTLSVLYVLTAVSIFSFAIMLVLTSNYHFFSIQYEKFDKGIGLIIVTAPLALFIYSTLSVRDNFSYNQLIEVIGYGLAGGVISALALLYFIRMEYTANYKHFVYEEWVDNVCALPEYLTVTFRECMPKIKPEKCSVRNLETLLSDVKTLASKHKKSQDFARKLAS